MVEKRVAVNMDECRSEKATMPIESGYFRVCRVFAMASDSAVKMDECPYGRLVQLIAVNEDSVCAPAYGRAP